VRRLIASEMVTVYGFFAGPNGELDWFVHDRIDLSARRGGSGVRADHAARQTRKGRAQDRRLRRPMLFVANQKLSRSARSRDRGLADPSFTPARRAECPVRGSLESRTPPLGNVPRRHGNDDFCAFAESLSKNTTPTP
jgi:hypothetical protein